MGLPRTNHDIIFVLALEAGSPDDPSASFSDVLCTVHDPGARRPPVHHLCSPTDSSDRKQQGKSSRGKKGGGLLMTGGGSHPEEIWPGQISRFLPQERELRLRSIGMPWGLPLT